MSRAVAVHSPMIRGLKGGDPRAARPAASVAVHSPMIRGLKGLATPATADRRRSCSPLPDD